MATKKAQRIKADYVRVKQGEKWFYLLKLPANVLTEISYVAIRGQSSEEGAIQRVLNSGRISSIKEFTVKVGDFPNAIVLNWVKATNPLSAVKGELSFYLEPESAQIIDGQHRVAGIKEAIAAHKATVNLELPVVIYESLSTQECADIFLSINTEQKQVPRSLVYDLYGIASEAIVDTATVRARDIAMFLHETKESPYFDEIKLPGAPTRKGGIALSTAVSAIKTLVEENGAFDLIDATELEVQRKIVLNLFISLRNKYGSLWDSKNNAFMYAAGFQGAVEFLKLKLITYCNAEESFEVKTIENSLDLDEESLIFQDEVKGKGGKEAYGHVYERLSEAFKPLVGKKTRFKV